MTKTQKQTTEITENSPPHFKPGRSGEFTMTAETLGPAAAPEYKSEAGMDIQNQQEGICNLGLHRA